MKARDFVAEGGSPADVARWWRFKVQTVAEGPANVYNDDEEYAPKDWTELETVRYKWQLDCLPTFDSQPHGKPLRERLNNYDGTPLTVSQMVIPPGANGGQPVADAAGATLVNVGAELKLPPAELPGKHAEGRFAPDDQTPRLLIYFHISAYNPIVKPVTARPRARESRQVAEDPVRGLLWADYLAAAQVEDSDDLAHQLLGPAVRAVFPRLRDQRRKVVAASVVNDQEVEWLSDRPPSRQREPPGQPNKLGLVGA